MSKKQISKRHLYFRYLIITLIISVVLFAGIIYVNLNNVLSSAGEQVVFSNDFYTLRGKPTQLQKDLFKELTTQVDFKIDYDLDLVELVAKNFVADYYTWANKQGPYDIGGGEFIFGNENLNFKQNARRYFYSSMEIYLRDGLTPTDLIEVETVSATEGDFAAVYNYYGKDYTTFYVEVNWTYKENSKIDLSLFPTHAAFTIIKNDDNRYEIVRFY